MGWVRKLTTLSILLISCGCAPKLLDDTYVKESFVLSNWLQFVQDGIVSKEEVIRSLGQPTDIFLDGRILIFRLILAEEEFMAKQYKYYMGLDYPWASKNPVGAFYARISAHNKRRQHLTLKDTLIVISRNYDENRFWQILGREAEYSLVLVFDDKGILETHRLLRVKP